MLDVLFNGTEYLIAQTGAIQGWHVVDCAPTAQDGCARSKKDWDRFWDLCGIVPSRPLRVTIAQYL